MAWQTPKTNWNSADVPLPEDFNRIENNTKELKDKSDSLQTQVDELMEPFTWGKLKGS